MDTIDNTALRILHMGMGVLKGGERGGKKGEANKEPCTILAQALPKLRKRTIMTTHIAHAQKHVHYKQTTTIMLY